MGDKLTARLQEKSGCAAGNHDRGHGRCHGTALGLRGAGGDHVAPMARPTHGLLLLLLPILLTAGGIGLVGVFVSGEAARELGALALITATVAGKFGTLLYVPDGLLSTPWHMAVLIVYLDVLMAFVAVWHFESLEHLPWLGPRMIKLRAFGQQVLVRNPWMRKAAFAGVVLFVTFPLSGTGAIGGSFFGQLVGMRKLRTLAAIAVGSIMGSCAMAALTGWILTHHPDLADSWTVRIGGVAFLVVAAGILGALYRRRDETVPS